MNKLDQYILVNTNTLLLGLQAGSLITICALLQVLFFTASAYLIFALIGVFLGSLIQTVAIHHEIKTRCLANTILAISAGFTTLLGSYCGSSLPLMLVGMLFLVPLVALSSGMTHLIAAIVLFTVDLFIVSSGIVAHDIYQAFYYGLSFFMGAMSLVVVTYWQRAYLKGELLSYEVKLTPLTSHVQDNWLFALFLTIAVMLATIIWFIFNIPQGFWIPMTVLLIFKTDHDFTRSRMSHRLYGTLVGSIFAIIVGFSITSKIVLALLMLPLILLIVISLARHYGAYTLILTIMVTVMVNLTESLGYLVAEHRLIDTLIGVLTVMLVFLVFRSKEWLAKLYR